MAAASNIVSLSLTAVNMEYVRYKIKVIEESLRKVSNQLARIERKLNVEYGAQLRSALTHAQMALAMNGEQNRQGACIQAIERLVSAEQLFLGLYEVALEDELLAVPALLQGAALSYVAAARCMIDLNERENACRHLEEGGQVITTAANSLFAKVVMPRRALFLRPELAETVSLERLAELSTMAGQPITPSALYEELRVEIWSSERSDFAQQARHDFDLDSGNAVPASKVPSFIRSPTYKREQRQQVVERVGEIVDDVESVLEASSRLRGLALEMNYLTEHRIGFDEWARLSTQGEAMTPMDLLDAGNDEELAAIGLLSRQSAART